MNEYISREAVEQVLCGIANGLSVGETNALETKDVKALYKIKGAKEILNTVDNDLCFIPAAEVQPVNQWISVKERFPDKDGDYLCYLECGLAIQATFDSTIASEGDKFPLGEWLQVYNSDTRDFTDSMWEEYNAITHWQPLPKPPKDGDAE